MLRQFDERNSLDHMTNKSSQKKAVDAINANLDHANQMDKKYKVRENIHGAVNDWNDFMNNPQKRREIQQKYMKETKEVYDKTIKKEVEQKYRETDFKTPLNQQKEKAKDAYKFARKKGIIGLPTGPDKKP